MFKLQIHLLLSDWSLYTTKYEFNKSANVGLATKHPWKCLHTNQIRDFGKIDHGIDIIITFDESQSFLLSCKTAN